ncbi:MAG TPA: hypothetical protein PKC28_13475 [Bdellovibrionales bacterium]|nr:hypothetical protein [Bdellovibrionales bacterium]
MQNTSMKSTSTRRANTGSELTETPSSATAAAKTTGESSGFLTGFDQMAQEFRDALAEFQDKQTPDSFFNIIAALKPAGVWGLSLWNRASGAVRRRPAPVIAGAVVIGLLAAYLIRSEHQAADSKELH